MARLEDITTNEDMVNIANAIRHATRTSDSMTIPQMPERLANIRIIEKKLVEVNLSAASPALLGQYNTAYKHFFIAMPKANTDAEGLIKSEPVISLTYDNETGKLYLAYNRPVDATISLFIIDALLADEQDTAGVLVSTAGGGSMLLKPYDPTKEYKVGELFSYDGSVGMTLVHHSAQEFTPGSNVILATQFVKSSEAGVEFGDLFDVYNALQDEIDERQTAVGELTADLEAEKEARETQAVAFQNSVAQLTNKVTATKNDLNSKVFALDGKVNDTIAKNSQTMQNYSNAMSGYASKMAEYDGRIETLEGDVADAISEMHEQVEEDLENYKTDTTSALNEKFNQFDSEHSAQITNLTSKDIDENKSVAIHLECREDGLYLVGTDL